MTAIFQVLLKMNLCMSEIFSLQTLRWSGMQKHLVEPQDDDYERDI